MSIATLKIELASRSGRDAIPDFFPLDVLISMTRELALVVDRALSADELAELRDILRDYMRKILEMQGSKRLLYYESREDDLMPALVEELYEYMCSLLVSKMIGYNVRKDVLHDRFSKWLEGDSAEQELRTESCAAGVVDT
jgi:hypothetical protein